MRLLILPLLAACACAADPVGVWRFGVGTVDGQPARTGTVVLTGQTMVAADAASTLAPAPSPDEKKLSPPLEIITQNDNNSTMSEMESLIRRLRVLLARRGAKAALARYLGVASPRISEWLRETNPRRPSGETALRLAKWAAQQERAAILKTNTPGGAITPAQGSATQRPKHETKRKSSDRS